MFFNAGQQGAERKTESYSHWPTIAVAPPQRHICVWKKSRQHFFGFTSADQRVVNVKKGNAVHLLQVCCLKLNYGERGGESGRY